MTHFIDTILNLPDERLTVVGKLIGHKKNGKTVVCLGNNYMANLITQFLKEFDIEIGKYCLDDEYWSEEVTGLYGKDVIPSSMLKNEKDIVLVIGFQNYKRAVEVMQEFDFLPVYYIDDPYFFYHMDYEWVLHNVEYWEQTYQMLEDEYSKRVLTAFVNTRLSGNPKEIFELRSGDDGQYDFKLLGLNRGGGRWWIAGPLLEIPFRLS